MKNTVTLIGNAIALNYVSNDHQFAVVAVKVSSNWKTREGEEREGTIIGVVFEKENAARVIERLAVNDHIQIDGYLRIGQNHEITVVATRLSITRYDLVGALSLRDASPTLEGTLYKRYLDRKGLTARPVSYRAKPEDDYPTDPSAIPF